MVRLIPDLKRWFKGFKQSGNLTGMPGYLGASKGAVHALCRRDQDSIALGPHGYLSHHLGRRIGKARHDVVQYVATQLQAGDAASPSRDRTRSSPADFIRFNDMYVVAALC